ncbi:hypothetical protein D3C87_1030480 [compost metagenome]
MEFAAKKKIRIATAQGASITLQDGDITFECPGKITYHSVQRKLAGPTSSPYGLPLFPQSICIECMLKAAQSGAPFSALQ